MALEPQGDGVQGVGLISIATSVLNSFQYAYKAKLFLPKYIKVY